MTNGGPDIVLTGIGLVTPLGTTPGEVMTKLEAGRRAGGPPTGFDPALFPGCHCAEVSGFDPAPFVPAPKLLRLMNRDAQLAVAAAQLALADAALSPGRQYAADEIALFGAVGTAGLPLREVTSLLRASTRPDGVFDYERFGHEGLRSVSPLLSFKILGNMPLCFVSICAGIRGPNAVYTPWEGQGAQAIDAGIRALADGDARCALIGGCEVKTHELAFLALQQQGLLHAQRDDAPHAIPGEGAVFLVLEHRAAALARGARIYAAIDGGTGAAEAGLASLHTELGLAGASLAGLVSCADGTEGNARAEADALARSGFDVRHTLRPKLGVGDLFAAAAALQVALAGLWASRERGRVLAHCRGHGSEQGAFVLSP